MMIAGIFEVAMLLCFTFGILFSINTSLHARTAKGKSLLFTVMLVVGYMMGITNKIVTDQVNYVVFFYCMNASLIAFDTLLYFRNARLDRMKGTVSKNP